ncbi:MAG: Na+/H+ antiporter NhaA [Gammaproteobacteria bacterium]|nr:Na+/H+ antiporter NhaA [Gammaproteobacteria bacterium]
MSAEKRYQEFREPLERRFDELTEPFNGFVRSQISGAVLLLAVTALALWIANSGLHDTYTALEHYRLGVIAGDQTFQITLHHWVNDGLMVLFFFMLGLEIKREVIAGELSSWKQSGVVFFAAIGGMLVPAAIYFAINAGEASQHGWGIPMATDTAFALGALAFLGKKIPTGLKVFLVGLAIVDDIGAILVITVFYTESLQYEMLLAGAGILFVMTMMNALGIRSFLPYALFSVALWLAILQSGVHATLAGVLAALTVPARPVQHPRQMARTMNKAANALEKIKSVSKQDALADDKHHRILEEVSKQSRQTRTTLRIWENSIDRPVNLFVIPLFAFLNAGIALSADMFAAMPTSTLSLGIIFGLLLGKPLGIAGMAWLATRLGWGKLPAGTKLSQIVGLGLLAGMGFTMSIFVSALSFPGNAELLTEAKASIMVATLTAGISGLLILYFSSQTSSDSENGPDSSV